MVAKGIRYVACILIMSLLGSLPVLAKEPDQYILNGDVQTAIPDAYLYQYSINTVKGTREETTSYLSNPQDIFLASDGSLYVADTDNNRIIKLSKDSGELLAEYTTDGQISFNKPQGVYVTEEGDLYIADTGNQRIVHLRANGEMVNAYGKPDSSFLADTSVYSPSKIVVAPNGGLYVLMGERIMSLDDGNVFRGFIGQSDIGFDLVDWFLRIFASEYQQNAAGRRTAASYENICMDDSGCLYTVSRDITEGQIKVLNSVGNNIYRKVSTVSDASQMILGAVQRFFTGNILTKSFSYGEKIDGQNPQFSDICVDQQGIITVIERISGKMYQYDQSGNLLAVFGGTGTHQGTFSIPVSLCVDDEGLLYVLDSSLGTIQVFKPSPFILAVHRAANEYSTGNYEKSAQLWEEVRRMNQTYPLAYYGLGNTYYKAENWSEAMECYQYSNDRTEYSRAFSEYRYELMHDNFTWVLLITLAAVALLSFLVVLARRTSGRVLHAFEYGEKTTIGFKDGLLLGVGMLFRPARTLESIKNGRGRISVKPAVFIFCAVFAVRLLFIYTVHYPLQDIELEDVNILLEFIKLILPILTWIVAVTLISSQFDGESTFAENGIAAAYAMVPYVVINLIAAGLSHVLCTNESGLFAVMVNGVWIWIVWLLIRSSGRLNDYTVPRNMFVCIVSLLAVVLIWFISLFGYSLVVRVIQFIQELGQELMLTFA